MHGLEDILVPIAFFACVFGTIYIAYLAREKREKLRHEERMKLIEQGIYEYPEWDEPKSVSSIPLFLGMGGIFIGLGLTFGFIIVGMIGPQLLGGIITLAGGLAFTAYYFIARKHRLEENEKLEERKNAHTFPTSQSSTDTGSPTSDQQSSPES